MWCRRDGIYLSRLYLALQEDQTMLIFATMQGHLQEMELFQTASRRASRQHSKSQLRDHNHRQKIPPVQNTQVYLITHTHTHIHRSMRLWGQLLSTLSPYRHTTSLGDLMIIILWTTKPKIDLYEWNTRCELHRSRGKPSSQHTSLRFLVRTLSNSRFSNFISLQVRNRNEEIPPLHGVSWSWM